MNTIMPGGEPPTGPAPAARRPDRGWAGVRRTGRVAVRSAAVLALLAGAATAAGLTDSTPALAATSSSTHLTIDPTCSNPFVCSQTFTSSGYFTTQDIGVPSGAQITFEIVGGAGGNADLGAQGGEGGLDTATYTTNSPFTTFQINLGGNGGNGNSNGTAGAGGVGGGAPGGAGSGTSGLGEGGGGGGGGGATTVYAANAETVNSGDETLVGVGPGGGGAAPKFNGGSAGGYQGQNADGTWTLPQNAGEGDNANGDEGWGPAYCGGAAASTTAGGQAGCSYSYSASGENGAAFAGGAGASLPPSCSTTSYGCLFGAEPQPGGGGGGGGLFGGGGGGISFATNYAASGGAGSGTDTVVPTTDPPEVTIIWSPVQSAQSTATTVSLSQSTLSAAQASAGTTVTATATVAITPGVVFGSRADNGSVQFMVNGQNVGTPAPVNGNGTATATLPWPAAGNDQVTASYSPASGVTWLSGSTSTAVPLTVTGDTWDIAVPNASGPLLLEVNGTNGNTDIWEADGSTGGAPGSVNQQWAWSPYGSPGTGYLVNEYTGDCLEVNGSTGAVDTWPCQLGAQNQLWTEVGGFLEVGENGVNSGDRWLSLDSGSVVSGLQLTMTPGPTPSGIFDIESDGTTWPAS